MKVLTIPQAVKAFRTIDPDSAMNETMLETLIEKNKIPYGSRGVRTVVNWERTISALNELLGFVGEVFVPKIRTIRGAVAELKKLPDENGMGEEHIRRCVSDGRIGVISIGNRNYIAMQSFDSPYAEQLVYGKTQNRAMRDMVRENMWKQMNIAISAKTTVPNVMRVKREK